MDFLCRDCFNLFFEPLSKCPTCNSRRLINYKNLKDLNIAHIDCDAFFASIHKREDPNLMDKPVIIGGGTRGVVATACYIARTKGVKSAMPMFVAQKLCPEAVIIKPNGALYRKEAKKIQEVFQRYTPIIDNVSIDEAYLDLSGTQKLHKMIAAQSLAKIAKTIEQEIGITVSIGLSNNKFLAKTASDMDKPRGFYILTSEDIKEVLWPRPISFIHGLGGASVKNFEKLGFKKIGDIANADKNYLIQCFGNTGQRFYEYSWGIDNRKIGETHARKSISTETTFNNNISSQEELLKILRVLCMKIAAEARSKNLAANTIHLKAKTIRFKNITRQTSLVTSTQTGRIIYEAAKPLLADIMQEAPFRLIGIGLNNVKEDIGADENDLINTNNQKYAKLEKAIDKLNNKFGKNIFKGEK